MRGFNVHRKKTKIVARAIPYYCIQNYDLSSFKKYLEQARLPLSENAMQNISYSPVRVYKSTPRDFTLDSFNEYLMTNHTDESFSFTITPILNGETVVIEASEKANTLFVAAFTSSGVVCSNQINIDEFYPYKQYAITTKSNWKTGIELTISEEQGGLANE